MVVKLFSPSALAALLIGIMATQAADAQTFGIETHNTLMPASGGMGGASIARPGRHVGDQW